MKKVFCWGTFDRLHEGHIKFLEDAKSKGNHLTVIIVSDKAVFENKRKFSKENQKERKEKIKKTGIINEIICASDNCESNFKLIAKLRPDVFVFGYDQDEKFIDKIKEYLTKNNIAIEYYISKEFANGIHTSNLK